VSRSNSVDVEALGPVTGAVGAVILGPFIASFQSRLLGIGLPDIKGAMGLGFDEGAWLSAAGPNR